jgi:hypothetical protein
MDFFTCLWLWHTHNIIALFWHFWGVCTTELYNSIALGTTTTLLCYSDVLWLSLSEGGKVDVIILQSLLHYSLLKCWQRGFHVLGICVGNWLTCDCECRDSVRTWATLGFWSFACQLHGVTETSSTLSWVFEAMVS